MNVAPNDFPRFPKRLTLLAAVAVIILGFANSSSGAVGTVNCMGKHNDLQSQVPPALFKRRKRRGQGHWHSAALKSDSTVALSGGVRIRLVRDQRTRPNLTNVVAVSAGATFSLALKSDGSLVHVGQPVRSEVPITTNAIRDCGGVGTMLWPCKQMARLFHGESWSNTTAGLTTCNGNLRREGPEYGVMRGRKCSGVGRQCLWQKRTFPPTATNVVAISAGQDHCLALRRDGTTSWRGARNYRRSNKLLPSDLTHVVGIRRRPRSRTWR